MTPLDAALSYAARGWPVLPLHTPSDGVCSCRKGRDCDSPGKHPRIKHGVKEASTDQATIKSWWSKWPDANVGVRTGGRIVVLDVDCHDADGEASLALLELEHDELPPTLEARTGSGGRHLVFACPPDAGSPTNIVPGVDVRGPGTYIVAPPSVHVSGGRYEWVNDLPVADLGEHPIVPMLRNRARAPRQSKPPPTRSTTPPPTSSPNRNVARARGIVRAVCGRISSLSDGRRQALLAGAHQLGGYIHLGLSRHEVEQALLEAARACGADRKHDVWRHIQYGLDTGEQTPLELPPDDDPPPHEAWEPYDEPPPYEAYDDEPQPSPTREEGQPEDEADVRARLADEAISRLRSAIDAWHAADKAFDDEGKADAVTDLQGAFADADTVRGLAAAYLVDVAEVEALIGRLATVTGWKTRAAELKRAVKAAAKQQAKKDREAANAEPPSGVDPDTWSQLRMVGDPPTPARTRRNVELVLTNDPAYRGRIAYCEFSGRTLLDGNEVKDTDETRIATDIGDRYNIHFEPGAIGGMLAMVGEDNPVHPVREYLDGLLWDGRPRLSPELPRWLGADASSPIVQAMVRKTLIAAVARVRDPGCKVDTVLILSGEQGALKSSALRALTGDEWFSDTAIDIRSKDARQALQGIWIYEWAELDSVRRSEATAVKSFISEQVDRYRPPYGRNVIRWPRQCIIVGTTNEQSFLHDATGHRRFWVVPVRHEVNVHAIRGCRDKLWAEAVAAYEAGEQWWLTPEEEVERAAIASDYQSVDVWTEPVLDFADKHSAVCVHEVLKRGLDLLDREMTRSAEMRVSAILQAAGWERRRMRRGGGPKRWWWVRPGG